MVAVTYGVARIAVGQAGEAKVAAPRKSLFARFLDALVESRMRKARAEIRRHMHLLPYTFDERSGRLVRIDADDMPFDGR